MFKIEADKTFIKYTVDDDGKISSFTLSLSLVEEGKLYSILHDSERYSCIAKIISRELITDDKYKTVSCQMYDTLEALAVKKTKIKIEYIDNDHIKKTEGYIADFKTKDKEEFLILSNGNKIRLDKIIDF